MISPTYIFICLIAITLSAYVTCIIYPTAGRKAKGYAYKVAMYGYQGYVKAQMAWRAQILDRRLKAPFYLVTPHGSYQGINGLIQPVQSSLGRSLNASICDAIDLQTINDLVLVASESDSTSSSIYPIYNICQQIQLANRTANHSMTMKDLLPYICNILAIRDISDYSEVDVKYRRRGMLGSKSLDLDTTLFPVEEPV